MNKQDIQWPPSDDLVHVRELEVALEREFPEAAQGMGDGFSRRRWLQLMGASLALGGMLGCRDQVEHIAPFAFRPKNRVPGIPQGFATTVDFNGVGYPLYATCNDGRPTKLDGHPDYLNGSNVFLQAMILDLYDPDRSREPLRRDQPRQVPATLDDFWATAEQLDLAKMAVLAEPNSSPTIAGLRAALEAKGCQWFEYASINDDNFRAASQLAFGQQTRPVYRLEKAKVVLCIEADPLGLDPHSIVNTNNYVASRNAENGWMSRVYSVESTYSTTGSSADHRLAIPSSVMESFVIDLQRRIAEAKLAGEAPAVDASATEAEKFMQAVVADLVDNQGAGIVMAGERQPADVHARALLINSELGNLGQTVELVSPFDAGRDDYATQLDSLQQGLEAKQFESLLILGGNPVYDAPGGESLGELIGQVPNSIHCSVTNNETSRECSWHVNAAHALESWGDALTYDGRWCVAQPLLAPMFGGVPIIGLLSRLAGGDGDVLAEIKKTASKSYEAGEINGLHAPDHWGFEECWTAAVQYGMFETGIKSVTPSFKDPGLKPGDARDLQWIERINDPSKLELVFETSRSLYDGRFANNGWLQELPDFFSKVTWDNVLSVSPRTARANRLTQGHLAAIRVGDAEVKLPVMVQPGQADGTLAVEIGYGRTAAGRVAGDSLLDIESVGQNVNVLRTRDAWHFAADGVELVRTSTPFMLALTQEAATMDATARKEINRRMGKDSALIRRGSYDSYSEFLSHQDEHGTNDDHSSDHDQSASRGNGDAIPAENGRLSLAALTGSSNGRPGLRNASLRQEDDHSSGDHSSDDHSSNDHNGTEHGGGGHDGNGHGGDSHGDHHSWPPGHHAHFSEFDLTPGPPLREDIKWGMAIDLNKCTGCNACVVACQSENNIPIVGKEQVWRGREMHWMRIDRYYPAPVDQDSPDYDHAEVVLQPVTCHHCENAPCETVCPVAATVHSDEGLNDMVYNRCIGTRYCGNNCPYKVRRFNYLNYSNAQTFVKYPGADAWPGGGGALTINGGSPISEADKQLLGMVFNPEVTVRSRGVMEKCTYCVQRIQNGKIEAKNAGKTAADAEVRTACQDACPAQAIEFGNLAKADSKVAQAHASDRAYVMLQELNNLPRTRYLARINNPHPALASHSSHASDHDSSGHETGEGSESATAGSQSDEH